MKRWNPPAKISPLPRSNGCFKSAACPAPFAPTTACLSLPPIRLFNLSKLSVWWLRLGIDIERIKPGRPQQNGRHERMHLTLKAEATRPAGMNSLQQQAKFDDFVCEFNTERPHEAIGMRYPTEIYRPSTRPYSGLTELSYPFHDRDSRRDLLRPDLHAPQEN